MKILLLEPDVVLARTYAQALAREGHVVTHRSSAQEAIHVIDHQEPDLIILELQLAQHSGIEFLYELRSYPEWQSIPVVLHTLIPAEAIAGGRITLSSLNVDVYLYKPRTTLQELCSSVRSMQQITY